MEEIKLTDVNLYDIGNTIQMAGVIWTGQDGVPTFITTFPGKKEDFKDVKIMTMSLEDWKTLLLQTDVLETEMFLADPSGKVVKSIYRKTQRQIDSYVQWQAFARDNYTCRYCGRTGIPLTVDHVDLFENGGAAILENFISACKNCNKERGNMPYDVWLQSNQYTIRSKNLPEDVKQLNLAVVATLDDLKTKRIAVKSR